MLLPHLQFENAKAEQGQGDIKRLRRPRAAARAARRVERGKGESHISGRIQLAFLQKFPELLRNKLNFGRVAQKYLEHDRGVDWPWKRDNMALLGNESANQLASTISIAPTYGSEIFSELLWRSEHPPLSVNYSSVP